MAGMMRAWHLYMIRAGDGTFYAGVTIDVTRRFAEHQKNGARCARYLRGKAPLRLVFHKRIGSRSLALKAEWRLKRLPKRGKERIVRSNPTRRDLFERLAI